MLQSRINKGVKSLMNLFKATTTFLEDIHDPAKRTTSSSMLEGVFLESKRTFEERKQAVDFLLQAVQEEADQERMRVIYSVLATVATYSDVEAYMEYDTVIQYLPRLLEASLLGALEVLYTSPRRTDIAALKRYLNHPSLRVWMRVLDTICHIRWGEQEPRPAC
jgi:hypothetical protein